MLGIISEFFNEHIRFKREENADVEDIWDLMICGQAQSLKMEANNNSFFNLILKVAGMFVMFFASIMTSMFGNEVDNSLILLSYLGIIVIFPLIYYTVLQYTVKKIWIKLGLYFGVLIVIGLILGLLML